MNQSFYTALTGAKSFQTAVAVTGANISNINTDGYRSSITEFSDNFSKLLAKANHPTTDNSGMGVNISTTAINLKEGPIKPSDNTFDMAIRREGWFGVIAPNSMDARQIGFTRAGVFSRDKDSFLVSPSGHYLLGTAYNNITQASTGDYVVNPDFIAPKENVKKQSRLFVPKHLTHPTVPTSKIELNVNLLGQNKQYYAIDDNINMFSSYNSSKEPLNLRNGQSLIIAKDSQNFYSKNDELVFHHNVQKAITDEKLEFMINGEKIMVDIQANDSGSAIASKIAAAVNQKGIKAKAIDEKLMFMSDSQIHITSSSNERFIPKVAASFAKFDSSGAKTSFSTLGQLKKIIADTIGDVQLMTTSNGAIKLLSRSDLSLHILQTDNSNTKFLQNLQTLSGEYAKNDYKTSSNFLCVGKNIQTISIDKNGQTNNVDINFKNNSPSNSEVSTWDLKARIYHEEAIAQNADLAKILYGKDEVNLKNGEDFWIKQGTAKLVSNNKEYEYHLEIPDDSIDGRAQEFSFTLNGQKIYYKAPDGQEAKKTIDGLSEVLRTHNIAHKKTQNAIVFLPMNNELFISDNNSSLLGTKIDNVRIAKLTYGKDFKTVSDLNNAINTKMQDLHIEIDNAKLKITNSSSEEHVFEFMTGINTNKNFLNALAPLAGTISSGASRSKELYYNKDLSTSSMQLPFDALTGELKHPNDFAFLKNGNSDINLYLNTAVSSFANDISDDHVVQNGAVSAGISGYRVEEDGTIYASFKNNKSVAVGVVSVFQFQNDGGLERIGNTLFKASDNSGEAFFYADEQGNVLRTSPITSKSIEASNIDNAVAMTNLIAYQRSFQSASKVITTSDELIRRAIELKR